MDIYREIILEHYKYPRNFGHLDTPDITNSEHNVSCGDRIRIDITFKKNNVQIHKIKFSGEGCAISIASSSLLTEKVKGLNRKQILKLSTHDVLSLLETTLTPSRIKCAVLPLEVIQESIQMWSMKSKK